MIDPNYLKEIAESQPNLPRLELIAAADEIIALRSKIGAVSAELAATKAVPITCQPHGWGGDMECAFCKIDRLEQLLATAYQLAGLVGAPVRFLDAYSRHEGDIDSLLPIDLDELDEFKALSSRLEQVKKEWYDACEHVKEVERENERLESRLDSALGLIRRACGAFAGMEGTLGAKAGKWLEDAADFVAERVVERQEIK